MASVCAAYTATRNRPKSVQLKHWPGSPRRLLGQVAEPPTRKTSKSLYSAQQSALCDTEKSRDSRDARVAVCGKMLWEKPNDSYPVSET